MKVLISTTAFLLFATGSFASDWSFNYLSKLYKKDADRCYDRCRTIMNLFPGEESAYYFAMKIQLDEAEQQTKVKSKNSRLIKAIDYAMYFDKNASAELKQRIQWDTVQISLFDRASEVRTELDDENLNSNIKQLDSKWEKYTGEELEKELASIPRGGSTGSETMLIDDPSLTETEVLNEANVIEVNTTFFGMPKGTENVPVFDAKSEKELLVMINKERKRLKMDTLVWNTDLSRACRYHAMDMGTQNYFDHNSYDRKNGKLVEVGDTFDRIRSFYASTFVNSENIAAGNADAEGTYQQWYNSPGHYANMFNRSSKYVGIGMVKVDGGYGYYWVFCTAE